MSIPFYGAEQETNSKIFLFILELEVWQIEVSLVV